jgi:enoyl-CoA hydratase/carnithine racemase
VPEDLILCEIENHVATLVLNRPAKKNSMSTDLIALLLRQLDELTGNSDVRVVVIRGAGDEAFCAGFDIGSLPIPDSSAAEAQLDDVNPVEELFEAVQAYPYPVIAMLNGHAIGAGCELAICCDMRIGANDIRMGMPPAKLGLVYPWNGLKRFVAAIGLANTRQLFYSAGVFKGQDLDRLGLIDVRLDRGELEWYTYRLAADIAANAPLALQGTKRILNLLQQSTTLSLEARAEAEKLSLDSFASQDLKEGQRAFLEKRKPVFKGQ